MKLLSIKNYIISAILKSAPARCIILLVGCVVLFVGCLDQRQEQYWKKRLNNPIVNNSYLEWHDEEITDTVSVMLPDEWYYNSKDACLYDACGNKMAYGIISGKTIPYDDYRNFLSFCLNTEIVSYRLELLTQHGTHDEAKAYRMECTTIDNESIILLQTGFSPYEENVEDCSFVFYDDKSTNIEGIVTAITWAWQIRP